MRYFATASGQRVRDAMARGLLGQINTPRVRNTLEPGVQWAADNGIYSRAYPGDNAYLTWLAEYAEHADLCQFAVAPDVVADHQATLERSWPMLRRIRDVVGRVALCAQNGATAADLPWGYFDVVFLAGILECVPCGFVPALAELPQGHAKRCACSKCHCPTGHRLVEWKVGAAARAITAEANHRGAWVHMGRVNSWERLRYARQIGCDSADGTYLAFGPDLNLPKLLRWLAEVNDQQLLWEAS